MSTIILITLSNKVIVLKKQSLSILLCHPPHNNHHPVSTLCNTPPFALPPPLPPHVDCWVPPLLTLACWRQHCENAHHIRNDIPCQRTIPNTLLLPMRASQTPQAKQRCCPPYNFALHHPRRELCKASAAALPPPLPWTPSAQRKPTRQRPSSMMSQHPLIAANAPTLQPIPSYEGISMLIITIAYQYAGVYSGVLVCKYYNYSGVLVCWS
jgi:hypothetical protein